MAETTNTENMIAKAVEKKSGTKKNKGIKDYLKAYEGEIAKALPSVMTPERFSRIVTTALTQTPLLADCTPASFFGAMLTSAQLGLEPNTPLGQAYLIPFKNNKKGVVECQFQIGYKGLIDLARRSGEIQTIEAHIVYENDEFDFELGLETKLRHKPAKSDRGQMVWVYAMYKLTNGGYAFEVMSVEDVKKHAAKYSIAFKSGKGSPWQSDFEEMAKKTVLKKVLKYAPLKTDYIRGVVDDEKRFDYHIGDTEPLPLPNDDIIDLDETEGAANE